MIFKYKDQKLKDNETIFIETMADVFYPTSTTILLLRAARKFIQNLNSSPRYILDLGCGSGIIAIVLAKHLRGECSFFASDICEKAVVLTKYNASYNRVNIDCRCGDLFEPWKNMKFNIIVSDIPGIAEPIARISKWYPPQIQCNTGIDGTRLIIDVIDKAPDFLTPDGCIIFPVLTLSNERFIILKVLSRFKKIELLEEQWFPFDSNLMSGFDIIEKLAKEGVIEIRKRASRWLWATKIYIATNNE